MTKITDKILGFILGLIIFTMVGGFIGFLHQANALKMFTGGRYRRSEFSIEKFITKEEYKQRTKRGWRVGYAVGAGVYVMIFVGSQYRHKKKL